MFRIAIALAVLAGCPGDDMPACLEVDLACAPQYVPTFDNVYANTMANGCGSQRLACHTNGGDGGVSFADIETAHAALLAGYVKPGDASCSEFIVRTSSEGKSYQMPPGFALAPGQRCALIQWVQNGAAR